MPGEEPGARPDGRTRDTRQRILREAEALYYQGGYAGINLQALARTLGLSKTALFHHFPSKEDLFFSVMLEMCASRQQAIEEAIANAHTARERLRNILRAMLGFPFFDPMKFLSDEKGQLTPEHQREVEQAFYRAIQQPVLRVLDDGISRGEVRQHTPMLGVLLVLNLLMLLPAPGSPTARTLEQGDPTQRVEELVEMLFGGIGRQKPS
jgi:AcrR family transcriptional regulator